MSSRDKKLSGFNYAELFQDIDWNEVNLIKLESDWRSELEQIERVSSIISNMECLFSFRKMLKH